MDEPQVPDDLSALSDNAKLNLYQELKTWANHCQAHCKRLYPIYRGDDQLHLEMIRWLTASIIADADIACLDKAMKI